MRSARQRDLHREVSEARAPTSTSQSHHRGRHLGRGRGRRDRAGGRGIFAAIPATDPSDPDEAPGETSWQDRIRSHRGRTHGQQLQRANLWFGERNNSPRSLREDDATTDQYHFCHPRLRRGRAGLRRLGSAEFPHEDLRRKEDGDRRTSLLACPRQPPPPEEACMSDRRWKCRCV